MQTGGWDDLVLMYFASLAPHSGELVELRMAPMQIRRMRLNRASGHDTAWLQNTLCRASAAFGTRVDLGEGGMLLLTTAHKISG